MQAFPFSPVQTNSECYNFLFTALPIRARRCGNLSCGNNWYCRNALSRERG
jgi:hypothetical protein